MRKRRRWIDFILREGENRGEKKRKGKQKKEKKEKGGMNEWRKKIQSDGMQFWRPQEHTLSHALSHTQNILLFSTTKLQTHTLSLSKKYSQERNEAKIDTLFPLLSLPPSLLSQSLSLSHAVHALKFLKRTTRNGKKSDIPTL